MALATVDTSDALSCWVAAKAALGFTQAAQPSSSPHSPTRASARQWGWKCHDISQRDCGCLPENREGREQLFLLGILREGSEVQINGGLALYLQ